MEAFVTAEAEAVNKSPALVLLIINAACPTFAVLSIVQLPEDNVLEVVVGVADNDTAVVPATFAIIPPSRNNVPSISKSSSKTSADDAMFPPCAVVAVPNLE